MSSRFYAVWDRNQAPSRVIGVIEVLEDESILPPPPESGKELAELPGGPEGERGWTWSEEAGFVDSRPNP